MTASFDEHFEARLLHPAEARIHEQLAHMRRNAAQATTWASSRYAIALPSMYRLKQ